MDCQEALEGYHVMYTPMAPGNYLIGIKYGGPNHIAGSPFKAKVTGKTHEPVLPTWLCSQREGGCREMDFPKVAQCL